MFYILQKFTNNKYAIKGCPLLLFIFIFLLSDGTIHLSGNVLSVFYDPPHLIKGMRNNFLSKNVIFEGKIAKWQDIVDVYNTDCRHGESRLMHKLTDEHVIPSKIKKMKVFFIIF